MLRKERLKNLLDMLWGINKKIPAANPARCKE